MLRIANNSWIFSSTISSSFSFLYTYISILHNNKISRIILIWSEWTNDCNCSFLISRWRNSFAVDFSKRRRLEREGSVVARARWIPHLIKPNGWGGSRPSDCWPGHRETKPRRCSVLDWNRLPDVLVFVAQFRPKVNNSFLPPFSYHFPSRKIKLKISPFFFFSLAPNNNVDDERLSGRNDGKMA